MCHYREETADLSTPLPRISCRTWWRWQTSCGLVQCCVAGIRVRSGRDEKFVAGKWLSAHSEKTAVNGSTNLYPDPSFSWACGRSKVMKNASVQKPLYMERLPFPCHPERSRGICGSADLSWKNGPALEMNCHLACPGVPWDRSGPGFPATQHWTRPRVRLSLRKAASSSPAPPTSTGNPG